MATGIREGRARFGDDVRERARKWVAEQQAKKASGETPTPKQAVKPVQKAAKPVTKKELPKPAAKPTAKKESPTPVKKAKPQSEVDKQIAQIKEDARTAANIAMHNKAREDRSPNTPALEQTKVSTPSKTTTDTTSEVDQVARDTKDKAEKWWKNAADKISKAEQAKPVERTKSPIYTPPEKQISNSPNAGTPTSRGRDVITNAQKALGEGLRWMKGERNTSSDTTKPLSGATPYSRGMDATPRLQTAKSRREEEARSLGLEEAGMRKGGKVKKMAKGGSVKSSASRRGDGIAQRGKTKGRML